MFLLDKNDELTLAKVGDIIQTFNIRENAKLQRYYDYYKGNQEIMRKYYTDTTKPCNRIVTNYCYNIVQNYLGYLTGQEVAYRSDEDITDIINIMNYNDVRNEDSELLRNALIYGKAFEVCFVDEDGQQRFTALDPRECIPIYSTSLTKDLLYVIRFYLIDTIDKFEQTYRVDIYAADAVRSYKACAGFSTFELLEETPNYYKQVPITMFSLNVEEESIFDKVITLQDAYNNLLSSEVDDFQAFCDAYLILKGCVIDEAELPQMKENRILELPEESAEASYLTKTVSDTQIENMLKNINDTIHKIAASPDFNDEKFMSASGIAMRYKLVGFENVASAIVGNMTKALQKRIELLCGVLNIVSETAIWRDIEITFARNLPSNTLEIAEIINNLRGIVSDATLLAQLPFVSDVAKELELIKAQNAANASLYSFGNTEEVDNGEEQ